MFVVSIKTVTGQEMKIVGNEISEANGCFYIAGQSFPREIIEKIQYISVKEVS